MISSQKQLVNWNQNEPANGDQAIHKKKLKGTSLWGFAFKDVYSPSIVVSIFGDTNKIP
uniref:Uncharacterized protein n=1 Tax=Tetranychus urticae TaxID=32264 RepID=T1JYI9_TETUR